MGFTICKHSVVETEWDTHSIISMANAMTVSWASPSQLAHSKAGLLLFCITTLSSFSLFPLQQFPFCPVSHSFTHGLFQHMASCSLNPVSCQSTLHSAYKINLLETQLHLISFHFQNYASLSFFLNQTEMTHISPLNSYFHHPNMSLLTLM